jgi:Tfp pilus assembly protein FimT
MKFKRREKETMQKSSGFTLLELMIILCLMGIIAAIAMPSFMSWKHNYRLKAAAQDVYSNFQLAKLTAVRRNTFCTISFNQTLAGQAFDYIIYLDTDRSLTYTDGEEVIVKMNLQKEYEGSVAMESMTFTGNAVGFMPNGLTRGGGGGFGAGTVSLANTINGSIKIVLSSVGGVRMERVR